jgi:MoxR-like ATPase
VFFDAFFVLIKLGYPTLDEEIAIIEGQQQAHPIETLQAVTSAEEILELQKATREIYVDDLIKRYIVNIVETTRHHDDISLGASPRGSISLFRGAQALALIRGRDYALPDDVKALAVPIISHRLIVSATARMRGVNASDVMASIVESVTVPGAEARGWVRR